MILTPDERLIGVDLETFGLNHNSDPIIEIGVVIADLECNVINQISTTIWSMEQHNSALAQLRLRAEGPNDDALAQGARYVLEMHTENGLWDEARRRGVEPGTASTMIAKFLQKHKVIDGKDPMFGSSVQFDRLFLDAQMPELSRRFSYRNIDVSTVKELCKRYNPDMFAHMAEDVYGDAPKVHRVLGDLSDTLGELKWYADNFFFRP